MTSMMDENGDVVLCSLLISSPTDPRFWVLMTNSDEEQNLISVIRYLFSYFRLTSQLRVNILANNFVDIFKGGIKCVKIKSQFLPGLF